MNFFKAIQELIFKISRWWFYLIFFGIFFLLTNNALAYTTYYGFDNVEVDTPIEQIGDRFHSQYPVFLATSTKYSSFPNSISINNPITQYFSASTTNINYISYYQGCFDSTNKTVGWFFPKNASSTNLNMLKSYCWPNDAKKAYWTVCQNSNCISDTIIASGYSTNSWHLITIAFGENTWGVSIDGVLASSTLPYYNLGWTFSLTREDISRLVWQVGGGKFFIDSMYFDDDFFDTGILENKIYFINPINSSIQSINDFYWEYNYKIATSSYWTTYDFLNVDLGFFHYTNGIVDATTTLSVLREPMNTIVPMTYYNEQITDPNSFPNQLGAYQAVILLKGVYSDGTSDTLSYDTITFGIATNTPEIPTAWCSNLCSDIATSTDILGYISNGVNCALRSAGCFLFQPHKSNSDKLFDNFQSLKTKFPASTFFDIITQVENSSASSTLSDQSFSVPFIRKTSTSTEYYMIPIMSSSTINYSIGASNYANYRLIISTVIYCIIVIIIIFMIL